MANRAGGWAEAGRGRERSLGLVRANGPLSPHHYAFWHDSALRGPYSGEKPDLAALKTLTGLYFPAALPGSAIIALSPKNYAPIRPYFAGETLFRRDKAPKSLYHIQARPIQPFRIDGQAGRKTRRCPTAPLTSYRELQTALTSTPHRPNCAHTDLH